MSIYLPVRFYGKNHSVICLSEYGSTLVTVSDWAIRRIRLS